MTAEQELAKAEQSEVTRREGQKRCFQPAADIIETADAVAVITMQDRERFYRMFQEFARENRLSWSYARKAISKRGRR